jgi:hypothetical protein
MQISRNDRRDLSTMFTSSTGSISIIAIVALASIVVVVIVDVIIIVDVIVIVIRPRECSTIIIGSLREDIVIIVAYRVCTWSLVEEMTIHINIDQAFNFLHPQTVLRFAVHEKVHAPVPLARGC